ncbi:MAG: Asp-tRNA(Asn)/Glu-tRNA(Gln) amidotransferase subunit GatB [Candidatus Komeilibacteria bacterium]|nr:Asp-tRNA(Asn)/Glu-tRNA(Gln) amidotransferase subunit GatB [Candidatus Komeilibacteria bacterium]
MNLEPIIGLEIHIQLKTKSKMFCSCSNSGENEPANTTVCPICLGHPGTLPVVNEAAVKMGVKLALALALGINKKSVWARKNYFYPDLAKGYQISQYKEPLASDGHLTVVVNEEEERIGIERLHLEEDAAKNFHSKDATLVDYNRAGTPLAEIVTKPEIKSPAVAKAFLQELRLLARYLKVSDADMEKGHLRCDANISLRPVPSGAEGPIGETKLYPKTEIKNINSFKFVEKALNYEIKRQTELWNLGTPPNTQSTRGWDEQAMKTVEQRDKEESADYRYFPEPDLPSLIFTVQQIKAVQAELPELPRAKKLRFIKEYQASAMDAKILVEDEAIADYFEKAVSEARAWLEATGDSLGTSEEIWQLNGKKITKLVSGWILSELFKLMNEAGQGVYDLKITPENFAEFIILVYQRKVNSSAAQLILKKMFVTGGDPSHIMEEDDLAQVDDETALAAAVEKIINDNFKQVSDYKAGKTPLLKFFIGLAMKELKGKADPEKLAELFRQKLS